MKRINSLKGRNNFSAVFTDGRRFQKNGIRIIVLARALSDVHIVNKEGMPSADHRCKLGISLGRQFGKAHERNKAKRRIRSLCTELIGSMKDGIRIIIRLDKTIHELNYVEQRKILLQLFNKAGVFTDGHRT